MNENLRFKYRAWHKELKFMFCVAGIGNIDYCDYPEGGFWSIGNDMGDINDVKVFVGKILHESIYENNSRYYLINGNRVSGWKIESDYFMLNEVFLMQCTRLKDKNVVSIFESDIILDRFKNIKYKLIYKAGHGFLAKRMDAKTPTYYLEVLKMSNENFKDDILRNFEIIGNIHENPDLLKEKENE